MSYLRAKKKVSEREKTALALGQKMDAQTINKIKRLQTVGIVPKLHYDVTTQCFSKWSKFKKAESYYLAQLDWNVESDSSKFLFLQWTHD